jgi:hypothetical protein
MNTLKNTKFWVALGTLLVHLVLFFAILIFKPDLLTGAVVGIFIGAATADLAVFGTLNVVASGQAAGQAKPTP